MTESKTTDSMTSAMSSIASGVTRRTEIIPFPAIKPDEFVHQSPTIAPTAPDPYLDHHSQSYGNAEGQQLEVVRGHSVAPSYARKASDYGLPLVWVTAPRPRPCATANAAKLAVDVMQGDGALGPLNDSQSHIRTRPTGTSQVMAYRLLPNYATKQIAELCG